MKRKCIMCGREFEAGWKETLCSAECRQKRQREPWRQYYHRDIESLRGRKRARYRQRKGGAVEYDVQNDWQLAAELAYWNYLIEKYPGGAG